MNYATITPGKNPPDDIYAVIEIPANSPPVKYEMDKELGVLMVDRFLSTAMFYPCNYGYIPQTLSEDGDPIDIMVLTATPLVHGSVIRCRPIGLLSMSDEAGIDTKLLAVPVDKLSKSYTKFQSPDDVPAELLAAIAHFFENYKSLEPGKWTKIGGWQDAAAAKKEIIASMKRYQSAMGVVEA